MLSGIGNLKLGPIYLMVVAVCAVAVSVQALTFPGSQATGLYYTAPGWTPGLGFALFLGALFASLAIALQHPAWGICAYVLLEYSQYRYGPELEYVLTRGLTEWVMVLAAAGAIASWRENKIDSGRPSNAIPAIVALLCAWAFLSAGVALLDASYADFEYRHHPIRYFNGLVLCCVAAYAVRRPGDYLAIVLALTFAVGWRCFGGPGKLHLDGDLAALIAMLLPLAVVGGLTQYRIWIRLFFVAIVPLLIWLLVHVANRGAGVGFVLALAVLALQSPWPRRVLLVFVPIALIVALVWLPQTGYWDRITGSLPGGSTYGSVKSRLELWKGAIRIGQENWVIGVGPGNYPSALAERNGGRGKKVAHNNFLAVFAELGLVGLLVYSAMLGYALIVSWRVGNHSSVIWPSPESRAVCGSIAAYIGVGMFTTRHDQALVFILLGVAAALENVLHRNVSGPLPTELSQRA